MIISFTITDMQREIAARFSHEASEATIVHTVQQVKMRKVCTYWVPRQFTEHQKNYMGVALNFLTQYEKDGNDLLEQIITSDESPIHFCEPERKSASFWKKKRGRRVEKIQE